MFNFQSDLSLYYEYNIKLFFFRLPNHFSELYQTTFTAVFMGCTAAICLSLLMIQIQLAQVFTYFPIINIFFSVFHMNMWKNLTHHKYMSKTAAKSKTSLSWLKLTSLGRWATSFTTREVHWNWIAYRVERKVFRI